MTDILTPTLGESVTEATVARWTKKPGDAVKKDEVLVELETEKVSLEVSAPSDGVLQDVAADEGATRHLQHLSRSLYERAKIEERVQSRRVRTSSHPERPQRPNEIPWG